jgi:galactokinase
MGALRSEVSDRAILRALHFYGDDQRVVEQVQALEGDDFPRFLDLVIESGYSSWMYCQNVFAPNAVQKQELAIALAASQVYLQGHGAWRVHGGGFAGTIQAFIPQSILPGYIEMMENIFGAGACHLLRVRPVGGVRMWY